MSPKRWKYRHATKDRLSRAILDNRVSISKETSFKLTIGSRGRVINVRCIQKNEGSKYNKETIGVYILKMREIKLGDKVAGSYENKCIIFKILPKQDMPYL